MKRMGLLGAMLSVCLFFTVASNACAAAGSGQQAGGCCPVEKQAAPTAPSVKSPEGIDSCKQCGMDRAVFDKSRMVIVHTDGNSVGTCSLNCVATYMKETKYEQVKSFQVADYNTRKLIDAKAAVWVIGGDQGGVMTQVAKWAFAGKEDAETFISQHGGRLATFDDALQDAVKENGGETQQNKHNGHECPCGHKMQ